MTRVKTVETQVGTVVIDGKEYVKKEVRQICQKCGSGKVEKSAFHKNDETKKLTEKWVCWGCETNYDNVQGIKSLEGVL